MSWLLRASTRLFPKHRRSIQCRSIIQTWTEEVNPLGALKLDWRCERNVDIHVSSVDVSKTVGGYKALVSLKGENRDTCRVSVSYNKMSEYGELVISGTEAVSTTSNDSVCLTVELPPQFDVFVSAIADSGVSVNNMECDTVDINTQNGLVLLDRLKASLCSVLTSTGDIKSKTLVQGSLNLKTESGLIDVASARGSTLSLETVYGSVLMESVYFNKSSVVSRTGPICLGALHGDATVRSETGDICIKTMDGSLHALTEAGDIDVHVARCGTIHIKTIQGNVKLKVGEDVRLKNSQMAVSAGSNIDIAAGMCDDTADTDSEISVETKEGSVQVQRQSWLDSLNINSINR
ncbi:uncharacterized protein LOC134191774 [Corticium candelabrum]|uniref:uncharacterized protein LOC134191774 n=1 Tax=Corticium candelabrum TaxID=121492 RepID=UPI002E2658D3|nr:uncharacterized protein LOC134191774 [Corticium candelabrum]